MASQQTRWWEYLWAHLGARRLTSREWKVLESLVRQGAVHRFKNRQPTTAQMLMAACDLREEHSSMDSLVADVRRFRRFADRETVRWSTEPGKGSDEVRRVV